MANEESKGKSKQEKPAANRRSFLKTLMTGTVAAGLSASVGKAEAATGVTCGDTSPLSAYLQEKNARNAAYSPAEYFEFDVAEQELPGFPGGGIWLAVGPKGSESLQKLRDLLRAGDYKGLGYSLLELNQKVTGLLVDQQSPFASLSEVPVLAEVMYAGKLATGGLFVVPGSDVRLSFLPYNGGTLKQESFRLVQYTRQDSSYEPLESLVIVRKPVLSELEQSILKQLPGELEAIHLGEGGLVSYWGLLTVDVVLAAGYAAAEYVAQKVAEEVVVRDYIPNHMTDDANNGGSLGFWLNETNIAVLEQMDVTAAATKLLQLRSNLVQGELLMSNG